MQANKCRGLLGFAIKAGKAVLGMGASEGKIRRGQAKLVLLDGRASKNTAGSVRALCANYRVPCADVPADFLSDSTGRANLTVAAVIDEGFARAIAQALRNE